MYWWKAKVLQSSKISTDFILHPHVLITVKIYFADFKLYFIKHIDNFYPIRKLNPDFQMLMKHINLFLKMK